MLVSRLLSRHWADSLTAERECNRVAVNVGDKVAVVVTVRNRGLLPVAWALVEDLLPRGATYIQPPSLGLLGSRLQLFSFRPGGKATLYYQLQCNRRGYHQIGPLMVETGDLFGLHRRYRMLTSPHFLLVYPEIAPLEGYDLASRMPLGEIRMAHRLFEDPTRIAGVRAYAAGRSAQPRPLAGDRPNGNAAQQDLRAFDGGWRDAAAGFPSGRLRAEPRAVPLGAGGHGGGLDRPCGL